MPRLDRSALARCARHVFTSAAQLALVLGGAGLLVDGGVLLFYGSAVKTALACGAVSAALGVLVALVLAAPASLLGALLEALRGHRWLRRVWVAPAWLLAGALFWLLIAPHARESASAYVMVTAAASAAVAATTWLSCAQPPALARGVLGVIAVLAIALDFGLGRFWYLELHDTTDVIASAALIGLTLGVRARLRRVPLAGLSAWVISGLCLALAIAAGVDRAVPGWRSFAIADAHNLRRNAQVLGAVADGDRDGYASWLWGGDCDDSDPGVHPGALDAPGGGDRNCNGVDLAGPASEAQRGLLPAWGAPTLGSGVQRTVLITVDTFRYDALRPELMPALFRYAQGGLRLTRAYSGGTQTAISVPLWFVPARGAPHVADALRAAGVRSTAVLQGLVGIVDSFEPFDRTEHHYKTDKLSAHALAAIEASAQGGGRELIWVHYFGLHSRAGGVKGPQPPGPAHLPAGYRAAAQAVDRALAPLLERLSQPDLASSTLVIVTSDHGEAFGAHGVHMHGASGFEELVHVPALVRGPEIPACEHAHVVSMRGMTATLLGAFGLAREAAGAEHLGRSLLRLRSDCARPLQSSAVVRSARYTSGRLMRSHLGVLVDERYKLVAGVQDGMLELYDRQRDPAENHDLAALRPELLQPRLFALSTILDADGWP
jgi:hypothetical protein